MCALPIYFDGFVVATEVDQRAALLGYRPHQVRLRRDRVIVVGERRRDVAAFVSHQAAGDMGFAVTRREHEGAAEVGECRALLAEDVADATAPIDSVAAGWQQAHGFVEVRPRRPVIAGAEPGTAAVEKMGRAARRDRVWKYV